MAAWLLLLQYLTAYLRGALGKMAGIFGFLLGYEPLGTGTLFPEAQLRFSTLYLVFLFAARWRRFEPIL